MTARMAPLRSAEPQRVLQEYASGAGTPKGEHNEVSYSAVRTNPVQRS